MQEFGDVQDPEIDDVSVKNADDPQCRCPTLNLYHLPAYMSEAGV